MKQSLFTFGAAFALAGVSQAILLTDNFDSYTPNATMDLAGPWTVTNGASGLGPIAIATDFTFEGSAGAALIGGFTPSGAGPTVLSGSSSVPMFNFGYPSEYTMDFGFLDDVGTGFRDDYKISLASTSGNLLSLDLTPGVNLNTFNISFSSDYFTGAVNWGTLDALDTGPPSPYFQVKFTTFTDGIGGMFYSLNDLNGGVMSSGSLTGTSLTDNITGLSVSVDTTGGAGDGFLVIDNVSVIPEPSSALLGLLGASFAFLRRRRA